MARRPTTAGAKRAEHGPRIPAGEFKAKCLQIMNEVSATHRPVTITK